MEEPVWCTSCTWSGDSERCGMRDRACPQCRAIGRLRSVRETSIYSLGPRASVPREVEDRGGNLWTIWQEGDQLGCRLMDLPAHWIPTPRPLDQISDEEILELIEADHARAEWEYRRIRTVKDSVGNRWRFRISEQAELKAQRDDYTLITGVWTCVWTPK